MTRPTRHGQGDGSCGSFFFRSRNCSRVPKRSSGGEVVSDRMYLRAAMGGRCSHRSKGEHRAYRTVPAWQQRSHQGDRLAVTDKRCFTTRCERLALFSCFGVCAVHCVVKKVVPVV